MSTPRATAREGLLAIRRTVKIRSGATGSDDLKELLNLLQAPSMLPGGVRVARHASVLLRISLAAMPKERRPVIERYIRELRWIVRDASMLAFSLFSNEADRERFLRCIDSNPVIRHGALEHGLWCLLWELHPDRKLRGPFLQLQRHALLTQFAILNYWQPRKEWSDDSLLTDKIHTSIYVRTLAIRHFVMPRYVAHKDFRGTLSKLPAHASGLKQIEAIRAIRRTLLTHWYGALPPIVEDINSILFFFLCADHPKRICNTPDQDERDEASISTNPPTPPEPSQSPWQSHSEVATDFVVESSDSQEKIEFESGGDDEDTSGQGADEDKDEEGESGSDVTTYTRQRWTCLDKEACAEAGTHPDDALPNSKLRLSDRRSGGSRGPAEMRNQLLLSDMQYMSIQEVAEGMEMLRRAAEQGEICDFYLFTLANTILARGTTESVARSIIVRSDRPADVQTLTLILPTEESADAEWLVPAVPIPYAHPPEEPHVGCRPCAKHFPIPDYWGIGTLVRRLFSVKFPMWNGQPIQPFAIPEGASSHEERLENCLLRVDAARAERLKGRFMLARLGKVLFQRVHTQTRGNVVLATYLTQRTHQVGEVSRYYDTPSIRTLLSVDRRAMLGIQRDLAALEYEWRIDLTLQPSSSTGYVGSPVCPTIGSLRAFISSLATKIMEADARFEAHSRREDIILRHDAYTILTFIGVTIGTCHRPNHGGIPDLEEIDLESGRLSIADKGINKARLSIAADTAVAQLEAFHAYVIDFPFEKHLGVTPELPFFLLGEHGAVLEVSASTIKEHLPFVANFARHLVRTELSEWCEQRYPGLSPERINALLGHYAEGEEPFGPHSSFNYTEYCEAMRSALGDLLKMVGYMPMDETGKEVPSVDPTIRRLRQSGKAKSI